MARGGAVPGQADHLSRVYVELVSKVVRTLQLMDSLEGTNSLGWGRTAPIPLKVAGHPTLPGLRPMALNPTHGDF